MICFIGTSFAPTHLKAAAIKRGLSVTDDPVKADLVFISEDTPTINGKRDLAHIRDFLRICELGPKYVFVLTSQVPPGFTRSLGLPIYHMAETLRVKDAAERALNPEQFIIGCEHPDEPLPQVFLDYLAAFDSYSGTRRMDHCPVFKMTWEEAEFAKIAINMTLASQVENTNRLAEAAAKLGCDWGVIANVLAHDKRIGPHSYLEPGDWKQSKHLFRDYVTLKEIEDGHL